MLRAGGSDDDHDGNEPVGGAGAGVPSVACCDRDEGTDPEGTLRCRGYRS